MSSHHGPSLPVSQNGSKRDGDDDGIHPDLLVQALDTEEADPYEMYQFCEGVYRPKHYERFNATDADISRHIQAPHFAEDPTRASIHIDILGFTLRPTSLPQQIWRAKFIVKQQTHKAHWDDYLLKRHRIPKTGSLEDRFRNLSAVHLDVVTDKQLKALTRGGIPHSYRRYMWPKLRNVSWERHQGYMDSLLRRHTEANKEHDTTRGILDQINLDIARTFVDNAVIRCQVIKKDIRQILVAYAFKNPEVGYCQSMTYLASILYFVMGDRDK
ncbi:hypothetical protein KIPB_011204, partial [Kipferlia bialata]|eukprot:g11204.t1